MSTTAVAQLFTEEQVREAARLAGIELPEKLDFNLEPMQVHHSVLTHNGLFTVRSLKSGEHRTFRVRTQDADAKFAPGKRIVSVLEGPDNTADYRQFGWVEEAGVTPWQKYRGTKYEEYCWLLQELPARQTEGKVDVHVSCRCRVCNRTLTTPESVTSGIGPICDGRS